MMFGQNFRCSHVFNPLGDEADEANKMLLIFLKMAQHGKYFLLTIM